MTALPVTIDVTNFGADPDGTLDSAPAIRAAFAHASRADGPTVVNFPHGRYALWPEHAEKRELYVSNTVGDDQSHRVKTIGVLIENATDLTVVGNESTLIFHGLQTTIAVIDSKRISVTGLVIDFAVPTVVDATVVETGLQEGRAYRILSIPASNPFQIHGNSLVWHGGTSPQTGEEYWSGRNGLEYTQVHDPRSQRTYRIPQNPLFEGVVRISGLGGHRVRIDYETDQPSDDTGLVYQMRNITRDHPGMLILESADVTLERMRVHFLHGFGIVAQLSRNITIDALSFQTPKGSGRSTAGFADFIQLSSVAGEVVVRNCVFDGPHDDPINIHGTYLRVVGLPSPHSLTLRYEHHETAGFPQFFPGDEVEIADSRTLLPVAEGMTVVAVDGPSGRDHQHDLRTLTIAFDRPLPEVANLGEEALSHLVAENVSYTPKVTISGNRFANIPTRGILVTTRRPVVIERNRFERISMASIYISADAQEWFESGPVRDVSIAGNEFVDPSSPVILIEPTNAILDLGQPVHGSIHITGNVFQANEATLVDARSVSELRFERNRIESGPPAGEPDTPTFRLRGVRSAMVANNSLPAGVLPTTETAG
ncbi:right-handed parallel beta-helix repeat-containing protein [Arthrobacter sp. A2-55]|uniref:right-handed parallel beta-helix repeat-containing protein n=1 Tax=Arthrobacter sp. A2-55 TaxID=2897337 RepID=UPI0021CD4CDF|nr:right-handed parallel beta-helix repeat-containing protein [Arthrobacter sp. A2-55]MCU6482116.1 hypothetical protein [Arthrobacter sp. A2-55]